MKIRENSGVQHAGLSNWLKIVYNTVSFIMFVLGSLVTSLFQSSSLGEEQRTCVENANTIGRGQIVYTNNTITDNNARVSISKVCSEASHTQEKEMPAFDLDSLDCSSNDFEDLDSYQASFALDENKDNASDRFKKIPLISSLPPCSNTAFSSYTDTTPLHHSRVGGKRKCVTYFVNDHIKNNQSSTTNDCMLNFPFNVEAQQELRTTTDCLHSSDKFIEEVCVVKEIESIESDNNKVSVMVVGLENTENKCLALDEKINVVRNEQLLLGADEGINVDEKEVIGVDIYQNNTGLVCLVNNNTFETSKLGVSENVDCTLKTSRFEEKEIDNFNEKRTTYQTDYHSNLKDYHGIKNTDNELNDDNYYDYTKEYKSLDGLVSDGQIKSITLVGSNSIKDSIFVNELHDTIPVNDIINCSFTNPVSTFDDNYKYDMGQLFSTKHSKVVEPSVVPIANVDSVSVVCVDDYAVVDIVSRFDESAMRRFQNEPSDTSSLSNFLYDKDDEAEEDAEESSHSLEDDRLSIDSSVGLYEHDLDTIYEASEGSEGMNTPINSSPIWDCSDSWDPRQSPNQDIYLTCPTGHQLNDLKDYNEIDYKQIPEAVRRNDNIRTQNTETTSDLNSNPPQINQNLSNSTNVDTNVITPAAVDRLNNIENCKPKENDVASSKLVNCEGLHGRVITEFSKAPLNKSYSFEKRSLHVQDDISKELDGLINECNELALAYTEQSDNVNAIENQVKKEHELPAKADCTVKSERNGVVLKQKNESTFTEVIPQSTKHQNDINVVVNDQRLHTATVLPLKPVNIVRDKHSCLAIDVKRCKAIEIDVEKKQQDVQSFGKKRSYSTGDLDILITEMDGCELDQSLWMRDFNDFVREDQIPRHLHRLGGRLSKSAETIRRKPRIFLSNNFRKQSVRETNLDDLMKSLENVSTNNSLLSPPNKTGCLETVNKEPLHVDRKIKIKRRIIRISKSTTSLLEPKPTDNDELKLETSLIASSHKHVQPSKSVDLSELLPCQPEPLDNEVFNTDNRSTTDDVNETAFRQRRASSDVTKKQQDGATGFALFGKSDRDSQSDFNATKSLPCLLDDDVTVGIPLAAKSSDLETSIDDILDCDIDDWQEKDNDIIRSTCDHTVIVTDVDSALAGGHHDVNRNLIVSAGSMESALSSDGASSNYSSKSNDINLPIKRIKTRQWKDPHVSNDDSKQRMIRSDSQPVIMRHRSHSYKKVSVSSDYIARLPSPLGRPMLSRSSSSSSIRSETHDRYLLGQYDKNRQAHRRSRVSTSDADSDVFSDITDASVSMSSLSREFRLSSSESPQPEIISVRVSSGNIPIESPTQLPTHSTPPFDIQSFDNDDLGQMMMAQAASAVRTRRARKGQRRQVIPPVDLDLSSTALGDETTDSGLSVSPKSTNVKQTPTDNTEEINMHPQLEETVSELPKTTTHHPLPVRRYHSFNKASHDTKTDNKVALDSSMFYRGKQEDSAMQSLPDLRRTSSGSSNRYSDIDSDTLSDSIFFDPSIDLASRKRSLSVRNSFVPTIGRLAEEPSDDITTDLFERSSIDEIPLKRCANDLCQRSDPITKDSQFSSEFTSCTACFTLYCSLSCRKNDWEKHKQICYLGRVSYYIKAMFRQLSNHADLNECVSSIAFESYSKHGRGFIDITFATPGEAKFFLVSKSTSFTNNPVYMTLASLPQNVLENYPIDEIEHNIDQCVFDRELVVNVNIKMDKQGESTDLLLKDQQYVRHCRRIPLHASFRHLMPDVIPDTRKLSKACETQVFTLPAIPIEQPNDRDIRLFHCRHVSKGLKKCGIQLKKDYPNAYAKFCVYVERNMTFPPITLYGEVGDEKYKCIIYPEGHHGQLDLDDEAGGGVMV